MDVCVVWRANERMDGDILSHVADVPAEHLSDRQAAVEHRRAEVDRSQLISLEQECAARNAGIQQWRILATDKTMFGSGGGVSRQQADVGAGQQGVKSRNITREQARLDTQNCVPAVRNGSACAVVAMATNTFLRSLVNSRLLTVPRVMSLYLS